MDKILKPQEQIENGNVRQETQSSNFPLSTHKRRLEYSVMSNVSPSRLLLTTSFTCIVPFHSSASLVRYNIGTDNFISTYSLNLSRGTLQRTHVDGKITSTFVPFSNLCNPFPVCPSRSSIHLFQTRLNTTFRHSRNNYGPRCRFPRYHRRQLWYTRQVCNL